MKPDPARTAADVSAALAPLGRRRFLKVALWSSAGVLALAAGGFSLLRRSPHDSDAVPADLKHLTPSQYRLFQRLAEVLLPASGAQVAASEIPVARNVDAILGALEPAIREQVGLGLGLLDNAAVLRHGRRLIDLEPALACRYVDDWVNSSTMAQRAIGLIASKLTHTGYWMDARTWPAVEFDGPVSKKWGIPSRGNQPLPA